MLTQLLLYIIPLESLPGQGLSQEVCSDAEHSTEFQVIYASPWFSPSKLPFTYRLQIGIVTEHNFILKTCSMIN